MSPTLAQRESRNRAEKVQPTIKVLSIYWGLSIGGITKFAEVFDSLNGKTAIRIMPLVILPDGRPVDQAVFDSIKPIVIRIRSPFDFRWVREIRAAVTREKPDYLLAHAVNSYVAALIAGFMQGRRIHCIATEHGPYLAPSPLKKLIEPLYNLLIVTFLRKRASATLTVAEYCANELSRRGVPRERITVVHNGLPDAPRDAAVRDRVRKEFGIERDEVLLGTVSRLHPLKGVDVLLDAFGVIATHHRKCRLIIIGDGPYRDRLHLQARSINGGDRVVFAGIRWDVPDILMGIDVFVMPSLSEAHSVALLEAMRAGCAIVATNVGGNPESVRHRQEGLLVPPSDSHALAVAMNEIVADDRLREQLARAARRRFEDMFTIDTMAEKATRWIQSACRQSA
jgi:glycosyltransferase involved in cell wall biosynthesis